MSNNYSFMILADGSIYCAAANLKSNKVSFDKDCLIGSHTIGSIKNSLIQEKIWIRICSILVIGFSHVSVRGMLKTEYIPLITTLDYSDMYPTAMPILNHQYSDGWDTGFYFFQSQSFQFTSSSSITTGWLNSVPESDPVPPYLFFSNELYGGSPLPFILKDDGIYVGLDDLESVDSVYMHIGLPGGDDVQDIGMIIQSEKDIEVQPPSTWYEDYTISEYNEMNLPNWRCSAGSQEYIASFSDDDLKVRFVI